MTSIAIFLSIAIRDGAAAFACPLPLVATIVGMPMRLVPHATDAQISRS